MPPLSEPRKLVEACEGRTVSAIFLVRYVHPDGSIPDEDTILEIHFEDASVVYFKGASDGERLAIYPEPWEDPFAEPLSPENREFVRESGKWTKFDVSDQDSYAGFIGKKVIMVESIHNDVGNLAGVALFAPDGVIQFFIDGDTGFVTCDIEDAYMKKWNFMRRSIH